MEVDESTSSASIPQRTWEMANEIQNVDSIYEYNEVMQQEIRNARPWDKDPHYFKEVKISAIALLKMTIHAKRGGNLEIMGLLQGRVDANSLIILDSFALPVEGTETRVNAQSEAYEYMSLYSMSCEQEGRKEKVVGWYHSHPGYGCWLSGIDVSTQILNQKYQEPWVAIVIDPLRTMSTGKVDIGAFRTYSEGYKPPDDVPSEYQSIPLHKIEDFGVHCKKYYSLDVSFFKSQLDSHVLATLWNSYWVSILSSSPLYSNVEYINNQMNDICHKLGDLEKKFSVNERSCRSLKSLEKIVTDAQSIGEELTSAQISHKVKQMLFLPRTHLEPIEMEDAANTSVEKMDDTESQRADQPSEQPVQMIE